MTKHARGAKRRDERATAGEAGRAPRGLSIHLELLEKGLSGLGTTARRHQVLSLLASSGGMRNNHVLEEAARRGELDARVLVPLGTVEAPDGTRLRAWRDAEGGTIALGGRAIDRFAPSPWGGVIDLGAPDGATSPTAPPASRKGKRDVVEVHVATTSNKWGDNTYMAWTRGELMAKVFAEVADTYEDVVGCPVEDGDDPEDLVSAYGEACAERDRRWHVSTDVVELEPRTDDGRGTRRDVVDRGRTDLDAADEDGTASWNRKRADWAAVALDAHVAAGVSTGGGRMRDLAALAGDVLRLVARDGGGDPGLETRRAMGFQLLESQHWAGDHADVDDLDVRLVGADEGAAPVAPSSAAAAAIAAFATASGMGGVMGEELTEAARDLLQDIGHLAAAEGHGAARVLAAGYAACVGIVEGDGRSVRLAWDGWAVEEAGRVAAGVA